ncbi:MAG: hypothetical protein FWG65_12665 [Turicibacter sp.]|nr:hypothetical protein [Turicibacter sp.]
MNGAFEQAMREVLERSQYDILTGRAVDYRQVVIDAILNGIINLLERINFNIPEEAEYNLQAFALMFAIFAGILLFVVSMCVTYTLLKRRRKSDEITSSIFDDIANKRLSLTDMMRLSKDYADRNNFREAVRYSYIAVLISLDDARIIRVDKSKTNAQLMQELKNHEFSKSFDSVVDIFHKSWFGRKDIVATEYQDFQLSTQHIVNHAVKKTT